MKYRILLIVILHFFSIISLSAINYQKDTSSVFKIIAMPAPRIMYVDPGVCAGSSHSYQSNSDASVTYKWEVTGGTINGPSDQQNVTVDWSNNASGTIKLVHLKLQSGCSDSTSANVTINPAPTPQITNGSNSVCAGNQYTYTGNSISGIANQWVVSGGTIIGVNNGTNVNITWGSGTGGNVKLIQTNLTTTCKDTAEMDVTINPVPTPQITNGEITVCAMKQYTYSGTTINGITNQWLVSGGSINGVSNGANIDITWGSGSSGKVKLIQTNTTSGCTDTTEMNITIRPLPIPQITHGESLVCSGNQNTYTCNSTEGITNQWVVTGGNINGAADGTNINVTWGTGYNGIVKLIQTNSNTGCKDSVSLSVIINPSPIKPIISDTSICYECSVTLEPKGNSNCTFRWYSSLVGGSPFLVQTTLVLTNLKKDTTFFVEAIDNNSGCISLERTAVTVSVAAQGELVLDMKFKQQAICKGDSAFIGLKSEMNAGEPPFTYSWTPVRNLSNPNHFETWAKPNVTTEYTLKVTDKNGSEGTSTVLINVNMIPDVTFDSEDKEFCLNDEPYEIVGGSPKAGIYSGKAVVDGVFNPAIAGIGQHEIVYTYTSVKGCMNTATNIFEVFPLPEKPIISENKKKLTTTSALTYQWYFNDIIIDGANSQIYKPDTTGYFKVEVTNNHNCKNISDAYFFDITNVEDKNIISNSLSIIPNPFTDKTTIRWQMKSEELVSMVITDMLGVELLKLIDNELYSAGQQSLEFDSTNLAAGVYFLNVNVGERSTALKLVVIK